MFNVLGLYYVKWSAVLLSSANYSFEISCTHATFGGIPRSSAGTPTPVQSATQSSLIKKCRDEDEEEDAASGGHSGVGEYKLKD